MKSKEPKYRVGQTVRVVADGGYPVQGGFPVRITSICRERGTGRIFYRTTSGKITGSYYEEQLSA